MPDAKPTVIHSNRVPDDYYGPLLDIAEIIQPDDPLKPFLPAKTYDLARETQAEALMVAGEYKINAELLESIPSIKIVANVAVGYDNFNLPEMTAHGVWGTNTPDAFVDATADATFALLLGWARSIPKADRFVRALEWPQAGIGQARWEGMELRGKTIGIIGYGKIGEAVAQRAEAFGMSVIFSRRQETGDPRQRTVQQLLSESDVVSLHTPLTPETNQLIDAAALKSMKSSAVLVNMARGKVVDEAALVEALASGQIAGAALDVFEDEPNVHPGLLEMENVVLVPHIGGATREARKAARLTASENIAQVLRGERPLTPLNEIS
ncbi:MAG: glyoxylate reductase [Verrucomicrobiales bacterium]|jgi:glyoxylate reductase